MPAGPNEQRLRQYLEPTRRWQVYMAKQKWQDGALQLKEVADAVQNARPLAQANLGNHTADAADKAFVAMHDKVLARQKQMKDGETALVEAMEALARAEAVRNGFDADGPLNEPPSPDWDDDEVRQIQQMKVHNAQMSLYGDRAAAREEAAAAAIQDLDTTNGSSAEAMRKIQGERPDVPTGGGGAGGGGGGGGLPPGGGTPTQGPGPRATNPPTNAPTNPPTNAPTNPPTNPPTNAPTNPPTNPPTNGETGTPLGPGTGSTTLGTPGSLTSPGVSSGSAGNIGGLAGAVGGGVAGGAMGLGGAMRGGLGSAAPGAATRAIGSSGRTGSSGALGRGVAAGSTAGRGAAAGSTAGRGSAARGAGGRAGGAGAGAGGRGQGGSKAGGRGAGRGAAGGAGGRGGRKDQDDKTPQIDAIVDDQDWVDDEDAAPGVIS